jgi:hypothetical protein
LGIDGLGQRRRRLKLAAARSIGSYKISIAKLASSLRSVRLKSRPEVTARKTAKYRRPARLGPFALQRKEDFLCCVHKQLLASRHVPHSCSRSLRT